MTRTRTNTHVALLIGALLGLAGCGGGSGGGAATGTLSLGLTDSPVDAEAVMIQFAGLELKPAGGPPELYEFNPEACDEYDSFLKTCTINLLDLWGTEKRTIFVRDLPVGEYQWVRLLVNAERNVMDSFITVRDELEATMDCPLWIPSGSETGLKIVSGITVATNGSRYMLDFDVNKSVKRPPGLVVPPANPPTVEAMCAQNYVLTPANRILDEISPHVAASAGAACHADHVQISHVLKAMQVPEKWAKGTLRLTTGRFTTREEIDRALEVIVSTVKRLRQ